MTTESSIEDHSAAQPDRRAVLAAMAGLLAGMAAPALAQSARGVSANTIKVGAIVGLTGATALVGEQMKAGLESYFRMVNDRGGVNGRKFEVIVEDNEWSAQKSVAAARKLVLRDNVFAILGSYGTAQVNPILPLLEENGVLLINSFTSAAEWFSPVKPNIYSVYTLLDYSNQGSGRWAAKDGAKKILVPYWDSAWNRGMSMNVEVGARSVDPRIEVDYLPIKAGTVDYVPHALEIIRRKPDAVIGCVVVGEFVSMVREMRLQGSKIPVYTGCWNVYDSLVATAPEQLDGVKAFALTNSPHADAPAVREYREAMAKYAPALKPDFVSLFGFAAGKVFAEAVGRLKGEFTLQAFYNVLNSMKGYDSGILPPVTFSADDHQGNKSFFKVVARNGRWAATGEVIDASRNTW